MLLSSGVVWRHRDFDDFRAECPGGDPALQRLVCGAARRRARLARARSAPSRCWRGDGQPADDRQALRPARADRGARRARATSSSRRRFPRRRAARARDRRLRRAARARSAALLAPREPVERRRRARLGLGRGAAVPPGWSEFYGRAMPAHGASARTTSSRSRSSTAAGRGSRRRRREITPASVSWSENDLVAGASARRGVVRARRRGAARPVRERTVARAGRGAARPAATSTRPELPFGPASPARGSPCDVATPASRTRSAASASTRARVLDATAVDGIYAAGVDAGGVAPAATRAGSRRRSCSASSRPRLAAAARSSCSDRRTRAVARQRRRGDLRDPQQLAVLLDSAPTAGALAVALAAARSRDGVQTKRR